MLIYDVFNIWCTKHVKKSATTITAERAFHIIRTTIKEMILTRGKLPPFCLLAWSCWTRSNIRYSENTATQKMAPPHTVTCFLNFILLWGLSPFQSSNVKNDLFSFQERKKSPGMQSFKVQKEIWEVTGYASVNGWVSLLRCLQPALTILETTTKGATAVDKSTKSAIAG